MDTDKIASIGHLANNVRVPHSPSTPDKGRCTDIVPRQHVKDLPSIVGVETIIEGNRRQRFTGLNMVNCLQQAILTAPNELRSRWIISLPSELHGERYLSKGIYL